MRLAALRLCRWAFIGGLLITADALACEPELDGCLGCADDELPMCLQIFVEEVCASSGPVDNCDSRRVYDDAERNVTISTGSHMSHIRSMVRSARKYQLHHH